MKPMLLELQNVRSYRKHEPVTFDDATLIAILGNTGAGKSTLLDAIVFALYAKLIDPSQTIDDLMSPFADQMMVRFRFSVEGAVYEVIRIRRTTGQGVDRLTKPDGSATNGAESVSDEIKAILGISCKTFLKTVLLPQGRFADLLTAKSSDRDKIFNDLFGLDILSSIERGATTELIRAETKKSNLKALRGRLPVDPKSDLKGIQALLEPLKKKLAHATYVNERNSALSDRINELQQQEDRACALGERLGNLGQARQLLEAVRAAYETLHPGIDEAAALVDEARQDIDRRDADVQGLLAAGRDARTLQDIKGRIVSLSHELTEAQGDNAKRDAANRQLEASTENAAKAGQLVEQLKAASIGLSQCELELREAVEKTALEVTQLEEALRARAGALHLSDQENVALDKCSQQKNTSTQMLRLQEEEMERLRGTVELARLTLDEIRRGEAAAFLSSHLHVGDACPVCSQTVPESFVAVISPSATSAAAALSEATQALSAGELQLREVHAKVQSAIDAFTVQANRCASAKADLDAHEHVCREISGRTAPEECIVQLRQHLLELQAGHTAAQTELTAKEGDIRFAERDLAVCRSTVEIARTRVSEASQLAKQRKAKADQIATSIAPEFRASSLADVEVVQGKLTSALASSEAVEDALRLAREALSVRASELAEKKLVFERQVEGPFAVFLSQVRPLASIVGMPTPGKDHAPQDFLLDELLRGLEQRNESNTRQTIEIRELLKHAKGELVEILKTVEGNITEVLLEAKGSVEKVELAIALAEAQKEEAEKLDARLDAIEPVVAALTTLKSELRVDRFKDFVLKERAARLLSLASEYLFEMTQIYKFTNDFQVQDTTTQTRRPASSLSGGEKFLASLALSLAVVDQAAIGGARIDSLFLDEGFAALDSDYLEEAMQELRTRARKGRAIWIITHLKDAVAYAHQSYMVEKTADGSQVRLLDEAVEESVDASGLLASIG